MKRLTKTAAVLGVMGAILAPSLAQAALNYCIKPTYTWLEDRYYRCGDVAHYYYGWGYTGKWSSRKMQAKKLSVASDYIHMQGVANSTDVCHAFDYTADNSGVWASCLPHNIQSVWYASHWYY
ncbi:MAG: hypothetical protein JW940_09795 [Polyangiaceae bacterium]|nr:hypothetical protein [Polyangiaceae bacterium]